MKILLKGGRLVSSDSVYQTEIYQIPILEDYTLQKKVLYLSRNFQNTHPQHKHRRPAHDITTTQFRILVKAALLRVKPSIVCLGVVSVVKGCRKRCTGKNQHKRCRCQLTMDDCWRYIPACVSVFFTMGLISVELVCVRFSGNGLFYFCVVSSMVLIV